MRFANKCARSLLAMVLICALMLPSPALALTSTRLAALEAAIHSEVASVLSSDKSSSLAEEAFGPGDTIKQSCTISEGGDYYLATPDDYGSTATTVTIDTTEDVNIYGLSEEESEAGVTPSPVNVRFKAAVAGVNLTFRDVSLSNEGGFSLIDLTGLDNRVSFDGTNRFQEISSGSTQGGPCIHVGKDCSATITGTGTLYLYATLDTAMIGGAAGEVNGDIAFGDEGATNDPDSCLTLFAMNRAEDSKGAAKSGTGPIIGCNSEKPDTPGAITFNSGYYYLSRCGDGGAIQGPRGTTSAEGSVVVNGANVYVVQNTQCDNLNKKLWSHTVGTACEITGDALGTLTYCSGTLLAYVTTLGGSSKRLGYDDEAYVPGINDAVVNLNRKNSEGEKLYPCYINTAGLKCAGDETFTVDNEDTGETLYYGALSGYSVEETTSQPSLNWESNTQTTLCVYVTQETYTLVVNGESVDLVWDASMRSCQAKLDNPVTTTYHIGYNLSGGKNSAANPSTYDSPTEGVVLADPTRTGYTFTGWTDLNGNSATGVAAGASGYQEFTANWQVNKYHLSYRDAQGQTQTVEVAYGSKIVVDSETLTTMPACDYTLSDGVTAGYAHTNYTYIPSTSDGVVAFTSEPADVITYDIAYELDGGANDARNVISYTVESPLILLYDPTKEGFSFDGWTAEGKIVTAIPSGSTGDLDLTAGWTQNTLKVSFANARGSSTSELVAAGRQVYVDGVSLGSAYDGMTVSDPAVREGWGSAWYSAERNSYSDLLLTTTYGEPQTYSITYDLDGGQAGGDYPDSYRADSEGITLTNPTRGGHAFVGFVDGDGNMVSAVGSDGTVSTTIPAGTVGDLSLKATWTQDYKTVQYLGTDGTWQTAVLPGGSTYAEANLKALDGTVKTVDLSDFSGDEVCKIPAPTSVKAGYGLVAYTLAADADAGTLTLTETPCLPLRYTITYDLAGGEGAEGNPSSYIVETPSTTLVAPTRDNYDFVGWYDGEGVQVTSVGGGRTAGNLALTARWTPQLRAITYLTPDGEDATVELSYGSTYTIDGGSPITVTQDTRLPDPTREPAEGYLCVGYTVAVDEQGNAAFTSCDGKPTGCIVTIVDPLDTAKKNDDGTYYRMAAIKVTVNGQELKSGSVVPNGTVVDLTVYPLDGYVFDQFTVNGVGVGEKTYRVTVTGHSVISAEVRDVRACTAKITDGSDGKVSYSITKKGIVYINGVQQWVEDKEVKDGDPLYEEDVLTLTAQLNDGAAPDDPDMTYLNDDGVVGPCLFRANNRDETIEAPGKYKVSATELKMIEDGNLSLEVMCPAEHQKNWLQVADTSWFDSSDPQTTYYLTTPEQLAGMVSLINDGVTQFSETTIRLARDISLENNDGTTGRRLWVPATFGDAAQDLQYAFKGTFDGEGHTISGLDISVGESSKDVQDRKYNALFSAGVDATFKNLTIEGSVITRTPLAAALVAYASDCTIENVVNKATVQGCEEFAGIVAELTGTGSPKIVSCRNEGTIRYGRDEQQIKGTCGGIVSNINELTAVTDCVNTGNISTNINEGFAGGIVGHAGGSTTKMAEMSVTDCRNYGSITVRTNDNTPTASHIGGIVGGGLCNVCRCANYGDISNVSESAMQTVEVGGIIGAPSGSTTINYCLNQGNLSVKAGNIVRVGGIAGWYDGAGTVMYCANTGRVDTGSALEGKSIPAEYANASAAGGLVGMASAKGTDLYYSYNAGTVAGSVSAENSLVGSAIGVSYGAFRLIGVLYEEGTAPGSYGSCAGASGALLGDDAQRVSADELEKSTDLLNAGTDNEAYLADVLRANDGLPMLSWTADRTVTFLGDDGSTLQQAVVPESFTSSAADIAQRYAEAFGGNPVATSVPDGCAEADFSRWDNITAGQPVDSFDVAAGDVTLQAVFAYDNDTYAIVYHTEDGTVYQGNNPKTYRSSVGVSSFDGPSSSIGEFQGWQNSAGEAVTSVAVGTTGDLDLYALWDFFVDPGDLEGEILYARQLADAYIVSADGTDVVYTHYWVSTSARSEFLAHISAAQQVADDPFLTQIASDQAVASLKAAEEAFKSSLAVGSYKCAITKQPQNVTVAADKQVSFWVETNDRDAVSTYEWQYSTDGENWNNAKNFVKSDGSGFDTYKLTFKMGAGYGGVKWRCKVTFKDGTSEFSEAATSTLYKESAPASKTTPSSQASTASSTGGSTVWSDISSSSGSSAAKTTSGIASAANTLPQTSSATSDDEEEVDGLLSGYASQLSSIASQGFLGLSYLTWIIILAGIALIVGIARSMRQSHKYDSQLKEWM